MDELDALWAFLVAAAIAFVGHAAHRPPRPPARVVHYPRERDLHDQPVPGLGGLAILVAVVVSALIFLPASAQTRGIVCGAIADRAGGRGRRRPPGRAAPARQAGGPVRRRRDPGLVATCGWRT